MGKGDPAAYIGNIGSEDAGCGIELNPDEIEGNPNEDVDEIPKLPPQHSGADGTEGRDPEKPDVGKPPPYEYEEPMLPRSELPPKLVELDPKPLEFDANIPKLLEFEANPLNPLEFRAPPLKLLAADES